jgi:hypothetical protein
MAYEKRIDELVGQHVNRFVAELSLARAMGVLVARRRVSPMPYGYPIRVYRPTHVTRMPPARKCCPRRGGALSNGVPWELRAQLVGHYLLGIYNPPARRGIH